MGLRAPENLQADLHEGHYINSIFFCLVGCLFINRVLLGDGDRGRGKPRLEWKKNRPQKHTNSNKLSKGSQK